MRQFKQVYAMLWDAAVVLFFDEHSTFSQRCLQWFWLIVAMVAVAIVLPVALLVGTVKGRRNGQA